MLLTLTTTHYPATDLGYLLHKHPERCQSFDLSFGQAHVFYPEANVDKCTAALLLDINPVKLVRGRNSSLEEYVSDRPYVASSFLSVAISQVYSTALAGRCKEKPELAKTPLPFIAELSVLPCRGGEGFLRRLFEPLGYQVMTKNHLLDENFPDWGESKYFSVELHQNLLLSDLLSHLYVLVPVLDDYKHYWIGEDEIQKLLYHGEGWLSEHPEREQITKRYLKRQYLLTRAALAKLAEEDELDPDSSQASHAEEEAAVEKPLSLNQQRLNTVVATLKTNNARRIIDLGCGQGNLLKNLLKDNFFEQVTGVDVSYHSLEVAQERLDNLRLPRNQWERLQLFQSSLTYQDKRFQGYDAATAIEVIEHLDLPRLEVFSRVLFEFAQPRMVVITTPNIEYNINFINLPFDKLRHRDHRFEWSRQELQNWANQVAAKFAYSVEFYPVGVEEPEIGAPTQMAVFLRE